MDDKKRKNNQKDVIIAFFLYICNQKTWRIRIFDMSFRASSTKERYDELQKDPLVFCKFGQVEVEDDMGYTHSTERWNSCDPTITVSISDEELPHKNLKRRLFVIGKQIFPNGSIDEKKEGQDIIEFEITEFNPNQVADWSYVFNDCLYNYKSGNTRHCHMALIWVLYIKSWKINIVSVALSQISTDAAQTACSYISANIFAFSIEKQYMLIDLLKGLNPNLKPLGIPDVENALKEIAPTRNFSTYGFYEKVDFILKFGSEPNERQHLESLYRSSRNGFIYFKYWMEHTGGKFFNYNYLEVIYSYVDFFKQLSIIKRYLHDVRIKLIEADYALMQNLRDIRYQVYVDIRYFITNPGDNIDLVAPMLCDALLTLKKSDGKKIQDFNGILDFAVGHSNKAYPKIDLGIRYFVPTCDGGLKHNSSFYGFIHYALQYTLDETKLTEDRLKQTVEYLLNHYATLQYHDCCTADNNKELSSSESQKCKYLIKSFSVKIENGQRIQQINKSSCSHFLHEPIKPYIWKKNPGTSDAILGLFINEIESKEFIQADDIDLEKLKHSLLRFGASYRSFSFWNGNPPDYLKEKPVAHHIVITYYSPSTMEIYPNSSMFYSSKKSLLGAWDAKYITPNQNVEDVAQKAESPIVYDNTFASLKKMFPQAEIGENFIKLPYDPTELSNIKAYYYYRHHNYLPEKGYNDTASWCLEFLTPRRIKQGVFYCTPKVADSREKVSNLPFFWCSSDECFCNVLDNQTLEKQNDWNYYTLYHAAEILGYKLIEETDKGNVPVETVANFAGEVRQAERLYARLICRSCGHMIFSTRGSLLNGSRFFACANSLCSQYRKEIYLSKCNNCKRGLIDSRDSKKCENGWVICPSCLACCNDDLFDLLIAKHKRNGWIPPKLQESEGKGHNNKDIFFCPQCGTRLGDITVEETVRLEDGTEDVLTHTVFGCPQCNKPYEKELKLYYSPFGNKK